MSSPFRQPYEESLKNARPNRYLQLLETGELSSHLDEVCRVADQEFDSIFARLKEETAKPTSSLSADGQRGFVQIMPPPPDDVGGSAAAPRESKYFELPPAPEN